MNGIRYRSVTDGGLNCFAVSNETEMVKRNTPLQLVLAGIQYVACVQDAGRRKCTLCIAAGSAVIRVECKAGVASCKFSGIIQWLYGISLKNYILNLKFDAKLDIS